MGGGGSVKNPCANDGGGGAINPNNKPQPPRAAGKYVTKSVGPAYAPPIRNTGCPNCGDRRSCVGGEYTWDTGNCTDGASLKSYKAFCANQYPFADQCPVPGGTAIGALTQSDWDGHNVKCQYNTVTIPFDQLSAYFDETTTNRIKNDRCDPLTYSQLGASSECRTYYGANLDSEMLKRIEASGNGWADDAVLRTAVNGYVAAELISNPPQPSDLSARGKTLIRNFCTANPTDAKCGCYNAIDKGLAGCQTAPDGTPGCAELKALGTQFDSAPTEFKPIFQQMKNSVNAMCLSENCKTVRGSSGNSAGILLPGTVPGGDCSSNFNVCLTKLTVGQMTGGNIDASCKQTFNLPSTPAPGAAAPGGSSITSGGPGGTQGGAAGGGGPASSTTPGGNPAAPGSSNLLFKDPTGYLGTKEKQMGAIAAFLICCCLIILLLSGGGGGDSSAQMQQMIQMKLMGL